MATLKSFHIVVAENHRWGKSKDLNTAKSFAGIKKGIKYVIYTGVLKEEATDDEVENILKCFITSMMGDIEMYRDNRLPEDTEMVTRLLLGWLIDESNLK